MSDASPSWRTCENDLERSGFGGVGEDLVGLHELLDREMVGGEAGPVELVGGHEPAERRCREDKLVASSKGRSGWDGMGTAKGEDCRAGSSNSMRGRHEVSQIVGFQHGRWHVRPPRV